MNFTWDLFTTNAFKKIVNRQVYGMSYTYQAGDWIPCEVHVYSYG